MPQNLTVTFKDGSTKTYPADLPREQLREEVRKEQERRSSPEWAYARRIGMATDEGESAASQPNLFSNMKSNALSLASAAAPFAIPGAGWLAGTGRILAGAVPGVLDELTSADGDVGGRAKMEGGLGLAGEALSAVGGKLVKPAIRLGGLVSGARSKALQRGPEVWENWVESLARLSDEPVPAGVRRVTPNAPQDVIKAGIGRANNQITRALDEAGMAGGEVNVPGTLYQGAADYIEKQVNKRATRPLTEGLSAADDAASTVAEQIGAYFPGSMDEKAAALNKSGIRDLIRQRLTQETIQPGLGSNVTDIANSITKPYTPFASHPAVAWDISKGMSEGIAKRKAALAAGVGAKGVGDDALLAAQDKALRAAIKALDGGDIEAAMRHFSDMKHAEAFAGAVRRDPAVVPMRSATGATIGGLVGGPTGAAVGMGAAIPLLSPEAIYRMLVDVPKKGGQVIPAALRGSAILAPEEK